MTTYESLTSHKWTVYTNPLSSGAILVGLSALAMLITKTASPTIPWQICGASMLFFTVYTQVVGLFSKRWALYMGLSYLSFIGLAILLILLAGLIAEAPLADFPRYKKTYALLVVFFIMLSMMAGIYRLALYLLADSNTPSKHKH